MNTCPRCDAAMVETVLSAESWEIVSRYTCASPECPETWQSLHERTTAGELTDEQLRRLMTLAWGGLALKAGL